MEGMRSRILNRQTITPQHQNQANLFLEQGQAEMQEMWTVLQVLDMQTVRKVEGGGQAKRLVIRDAPHQIIHF